VRRLVDTSVVGDAVEYAEPRRALAAAPISKLRQVRAPFLVSLDGFGVEPAAGLTLEADARSPFEEVSRADKNGSRTGV
jgi:hypothetical protein